MNMITNINDQQNNLFFKFIFYNLKGYIMFTLMVEGKLAFYNIKIKGKNKSLDEEDKVQSFTKKEIEEIAKYSPKIKILSNN